MVKERGVCAYSSLVTSRPRRRGASVCGVEALTKGARRLGGGEDRVKILKAAEDSRRALAEALGQIKKDPTEVHVRRVPSCDRGRHHGRCECRVLELRDRSARCAILERHPSSSLLTHVQRRSWLSFRRRRWRLLMVKAQELSRFSGLSLVERGQANRPRWLSGPVGVGTRQ